MFVNILKADRQNFGVKHMALIYREIVSFLTTALKVGVLKRELNIY